MCIHNDDGKMDFVYALFVQWELKNSRKFDFKFDVSIYKTVQKMNEKNHLPE